MSDQAPRVIHPRFVALDSSHLGAFAADKTSTDPARLTRAKTFEQTLEESGNILLLCWHHLKELFSHRSEDIVTQRVAFLQSLPMVAAIASFRKDNVIGTIADLQSFEVAAAFENPAADALAVRDEAAKSMFRLASGANLVEPFLQHWSTYRTAFIEREQRNREVVAISKSKFAGNADEKIVDLLKGRLRASDEIQQQFQQLHGRLASDIRLHGDSRILDPEQASLTFIEGARQLGMETLRVDNPALGILAAFGLNLSDIGPNTTVADVSNLAVFRRKLGILNENLKLPWPELIAKVKEDRLPSGVIYSAVRRFHPNTREWDGSELADRYLACLSAYADVTYVDKRMHEAFRQARQKLEAFATLVRRVGKAGEYGEIAGQLTVQFPEVPS